MKHRLALALLLVAAAFAPGAAAGRTVAVGDVHGAYDELVSILRSSGLLDADGHWSGGEATLVQTGDLLDRGPRVREVLDLLRRLQAEAAAAGGRVEVLLGNHEQMTLLGEYRDVAAATWEEFVDGSSEHRRKQAWKEWKAWVVRRAAERGGAPPDFDRALHEQWLEEHPPGFLEYVEAFAPEGEYGRWLRQRPLVANVGDAFFIHAGVAPDKADLTPDLLDEKERGYIRELDRDRRGLVEAGVILPFFTLAEIVHVVRNETGENGGDAAQRRLAVAAAAATLAKLEEHLGEESLFWYRGWSELPDDRLAALADRLTASLRAHRFVAGHSPSRDGEIHVRLGGRFALIDTGMLTERYGGRPSALEIADGRLTALYVDAPAERLGGGAAATGESVLRPRPAARQAGSEPAGGPEPTAAGAPVWRGSDGEPLPFRSEAEIERFLADARIVSDERIPEGITKPRKLLLESGGVSAHAAFRYHHSQDMNVRLADGTRRSFFIDSYRNEVAAYRLSRLLGLHNVPPAVLRTVDRKDGSLQLWVEGARTEKSLQADGVSVPVEKVLWRNRQSWDMKVFDNLIDNIDRNAGNILWDTDWNLWLIDHTRAFARTRELVRPDEVGHCSRRLLAALEGLDEAALEAPLKGLLGRYEIRALLERRDLLVRRLHELVEERGEAAVLFDHEDPGPAVTVSYDEG